LKLKGFSGSILIYRRKWMSGLRKKWKKTGKR